MKDKIKEIKKCLIVGYDTDIITQEELNILWNYITNLQEENEYLKKHQRFHKKFGDDYIFCVEGDKETYKDLLLEKQEIIEKAIEYIKSFEYYIPEDNKEDLLNILKGE